jgi:taurine dioxygenase
MGNLKVRRLGYALGAEITGVDASKALGAETIAAIRQAILDHIVVSLPRQNLDPDELVAFSAQFGELDDNRGSLRRFPHEPRVIVVANQPVTIDGEKRAGERTLADSWHTDYSFSDHPSTLTFLLAKELPEVGGDTMFANMYVAYETLSVAFKKMIEPLSGVFDFTVGHAYQAASAENKEKMKRQKPTAVHRLVRVHPETGRKAVYFSDRVRNFVGMTEEETKPLLAFLMEHATRYEFTYRHRWALHDLVVWDQRSSLHFAVSDYDRSQLRRMIRTTLLGPKSGSLLHVDGAEPVAVQAAAM